MSDALLMDVMTGPPLKPSAKLHYANKADYDMPICGESVVTARTRTRWNAVTCKRCLRYKRHSESLHSKEKT
jgi:hypothetical protein